MTKADLRMRTTEELVQVYAELGQAQSAAIFDDETAEFNRLFKIQMALETELKSRPGDHRRALLELYDHTNAQVRLNAYKATLAIEPKAAREALQHLAASGEQPEAMDAGMAIWTLDEGIFRPD